MTLYFAAGAGPPIPAPRIPAWEPPAGPVPRALAESHRRAGEEAGWADPQARPGIPGGPPLRGVRPGLFEIGHNRVGVFIPPTEAPGEALAGAFDNMRPMAVLLSAVTWAATWLPHGPDAAEAAAAIRAALLDLEDSQAAPARAVPEGCRIAPPPALTPEEAAGAEAAGPARTFARVVADVTRAYSPAQAPALEGRDLPRLARYLEAEDRYVLRVHGERRAPWLLRHIQGTQPFCRESGLFPDPLEADDLALGAGGVSHDPRQYLYSRDRAVAKQAGAPWEIYPDMSGKTAAVDFQGLAGFTWRHQNGGVTVGHAAINQSEKKAEGNNPHLEDLRLLEQAIPEADRRAGAEVRPVPLKGMEHLARPPKQSGGAYYLLKSNRGNSQGTMFRIAYYAPTDAEGDADGEE